MQNNPLINKENVNRFLCENCGANMIFDPQHGQLVCPYCENKKAIESGSGSITEKDFYSYLRPDAERLQPMAKDAMQVSCDSCGATVTFVPPETARNCDFCGGKIVAQPKSADPLVAPEGVLPFSITTQAASAELKTWINSRWFAPGNLKILAQPDKIGSVYIPYWTFDADTYSSYSGERGEYYYQTEYYEENGEQKSRQVRYTNWFGASGAVSRHFDDLYIPATKSLLPDYVKRLNWEFGELVPYEPAYLAGHKAQTYQVSLEEGFELFKQDASAIIYNDVRIDIGGDEQRIHNVNIDYSNVTFKHLLLPVYAGAYRYNNRVFQIVVNGRTGEVQGERPFSWLKIGCLVVVILTVLLVILAIAAASR
jgi:DNA-directed RNA polymerase subunit RPC12/RpoP